MLKPEEIIPACVGELYRYRLAVHDQRPRLQAATKALVAEGDLIRRDKRELLFAPSMSQEDFRQQLESIHYRNTDLWWRLKTEAQFLLVAVYGVLAMSKAIRKASVGDVNSCVQRAISAFDKAAPDADLLRNLHEHMEAYMRGEGKDTDRLPDPTDSGVVAALDEGPVYWVGGKLFVLSEIAGAAEDLARAVAACTT